MRYRLSCQFPIFHRTCPGTLLHVLRHRLSPFFSFFSSVVRTVVESTIAEFFRDRYAHYSSHNWHFDLPLSSIPRSCGSVQTSSLVVEPSTVIRLMLQKSNPFEINMLSYRALLLYNLPTFRRSKNRNSSQPKNRSQQCLCQRLFLCIFPWFSCGMKIKKKFDL